jgi:hypothetical protein
VEPGIGNVACYLRRGRGVAVSDPLCTRLSCLETGAIVATIKAVARGERPDIAEASECAQELAELAHLIQLPLAMIVSGTLTRTEALALLADEPCPQTERNFR